MKCKIKKLSENPSRSGCKDIWNAFMCKNADFGTTGMDIPYCPTTATTLPNAIITWTKAKEIYTKNIQRKNYDFKYDAFVCWYIDDYKFDGPRGIWHDYNHTLKVLKHFSGVITPDFSTFQDFPEPIKSYNTYRMRVYGIWLGRNNIPVINNVRWGTPETYRYCWEGIPHHSIVAIGTVGGSPRKTKDRYRFENGLNEMVRILHPKTIITYGSANYPCFEKLKQEGITVIQYPSETSEIYEGRKSNE